MKRRLLLMLLIAAAGSPMHFFGQGSDLPGGPGREGEEQKGKKKFVPKERILSEEYKVSEDRIQKIGEIVRKYFDNRADLNDEGVKSSIFAEIGKIVPMKPSQPADTRALPSIKESQRSRVEEKFSKSAEQIKKEAIAECDTKFAMVKLRDKVVVYYTRGNETLRVDGTFYGFGGGSLRINSRYIPIYDLTPDTRVKFDKKYNDAAREEFVESSVRNYLAERLDYSEKLFAEEYKKIRQNNEKLGYILRKQDWITAQTVADEFLKEFQQEAKARAEKEAAEKAVREKTKRDAGGNPFDANGEPQRLLDNGAPPPPAQ